LGSDALHEPVLAAEVVDLLSPRPEGVYADATLGWGGHTAALIAAGAGRVIAIDRDAEALRQAEGRLTAAGLIDRVDLVHGDYRDLGHIVAARGLTTVDGVLVDLGVSSMQIDTPERGFSFRMEGPLDMRMDRSQGPTLAERLARVDERALADLIWRFGEERHARRVARAIVDARDRGVLHTTTDLAAVVRRSVGGRGWQRIDPATRTFQALRIWVNDELDGLEAFIVAASRLLASRARLAVIAFHSLEDRVVKHTFRRLTSGEPGLRLVTRRPIVPSEAERGRNARARSARLRAMERAA
jgi:16S rRNA (cytosine1402-N4)-methyltransferase